ncbi:hypothetical protein CANCADRAFT_55489 [Tortispora caseinolytica NRRL Y-17796]|uniref:BAR domain-containing protein n=1 Tax=Tortispora caseinolytica NRRL Y-17796 TaxID=767744 RepID=A0A1E4TIS6_9ASCO|nr:hypothetical protein CANCADRAFT_55489 [Tortispora caseinolytica NRRL Y-17796]
MNQVSDKWNGAKKAFARTPHMFIGNKSKEDPLIIEWSKDLVVASTGLSEIAHDCKNFVNAWQSILSGQLTYSGAIHTVYDDIPDERPDVDNGTTPEETMNRLDNYIDAMETLHERAEPLIQLLHVRIVQPCEAAHEHVEAALKELKKRAHKKIDYDRHLETVEKLQKKKPLSDKDRLALDKADIELKHSTRIFNEHDKAIREMVPRLITLLEDLTSSLLTQMTMLLSDLFRRMQDTVQSYAAISGLIRSGIVDSDGGEIQDGSHGLYIPAVEDIENTWKEKVSPIVEQIESQFRILLDSEVGSTKSLSKTLVSSTTKGVTKAGQFTLSGAKSAAQSTRDLKRRKLRAADPINGIFRYSSIRLEELTTNGKKLDVKVTADLDESQDDEVSEATDSLMGTTISEPKSSGVDSTDSRKLEEKLSTPDLSKNTPVTPQNELPSDPMSNPELLSNPSPLVDSLEFGESRSK